MKQVGIFGGSFDPIHNGHIRLAQYVLDHTDLDEVWLMVSPLNPLKPQGYVATDRQRLDMARLAVADIPGVKVSDFEFSLPIPSYTYNTLKKLKETYPGIDFRLIIGGDNWAEFDRWKNPREILTEFGLIVYPRPGQQLSPQRPLPPSPSALHTSNIQRPTSNASSLIILDSAPQMPVSSTQLRTLLKEGTPDSPVGTHGSCVREHSMGQCGEPPQPLDPSALPDSSPLTLDSLKSFLPSPVLNYIKEQSLYLASTQC